MEPQDWHTMYNFSADALLLVLASETYDLGDYIDEEYA
jgi:WxcM-like, C-terminal